MSSSSPFAVRCTLTFGDIYGQILAWMAVIFVSLASGLALMGSSKPLVRTCGCRADSCVELALSSIRLCHDLC